MNAADQLAYASAVDLGARLQAGDLSSRALVAASLERIRLTEPRVHAFTYVDAAGAEQAAARSDARRAGGAALGPLDGLPVAIKDLQAVAGMPLERGSPLFRGERAEVDSPAVARLRAAGAVIIGKTATPELGHLAFTHSQLGPATRNPWSRTHTCGGSSGGSAVALAAGQVPLAIGTDGGGSIRIPASCCGVVGLKPSLGRVPYAPMLSGLDTLSHLGPMARNVADVALMLSVLAGPHDEDWATLPADSADYRTATTQSVEGGHVGWAPQLGPTAPDTEVMQVCAASLDAFRTAGCNVEEIEPFLSDWVEPWQTVFDTMLSVVVEDRLDEVRRASDPSFVAVIERAQAYSATDFMRAAAARRAVWAQLGPLFTPVDVLVTPTLLLPPLPVDPDTGIPADPNAWSATSFRHVYPFNLTGQPAICLPAGVTVEGLPVGLQIIGSRHADATVLRFAAAFEQHRRQFQLRPALVPA